MKIGVLMNVYNEKEWIDTAMWSIIHWADEIVIIEGAYGIAMEAGAPARSDDGTLHSLEKWNLNEHVTVVHENERDEAQQLQKGLEILKQKGVDWYLLVDGDEVWRQQDLTMIRKFMERGDKYGIYQYRVKFYNFINSFDKYYDGTMKRVFKLTPGAVAVGQNGLAWPDHGKGVDIGGNQPHIGMLPPTIACFHYTEIKNPERWLLKKRYLKVRDGNPRFDSWTVTKDGFDNGEKDIFSFTKDHPDIVKSGRLYRKWEENPEEFKKFMFGVYDE